MSVSAVLPISGYIADQVASIAREQNRRIPTLEVPILWDPGNVLTPTREQIPECTYVLFSGSLDYIDIVRKVVDIAVELKRRNLSVRVKITGSGSQKNVTAFGEYVESNGVKERIDVLGFLDDDKLYEVQRCALALLAPLPQNLQSVSRFPTKLACYMASGRPVIASAVGEISHYFKHRVDAFLVSPEGRPSEFVDNIEYILANPQIAAGVAQRGTELTMREFNCYSQGERLARFIQTLLGAETP